MYDCTYYRLQLGTYTFYCISTKEDVLEILASYLANEFNIVGAVCSLYY